MERAYLIPAILLASIAISLIIYFTVESTIGGDEAKTTTKPNILFIMMDDLGFNDVSWNNPIVHMPVMDKLAREGVILDRNYAHTVCSPSRAEFMTGKYAHRLGMQHWVIQPDAARYMPLTENTLGERLQEVGYSTHLLGKWHLGSCRKEAWPTNRGFDSFYGCFNGYIDSWNQCTNWMDGTGPDWWNNETPDSSGNGTHVTDLMKERATEIIQDSDGSKPLFLFLSFFAPHIPVQTTEKYSDLYKTVNDTWRRDSLGMISHVDEAVGEVIQTLKEKGLFDNTIIAMTSDNGGFTGPSSNFPLRGAKGSTFEGGQRVPGFFSGPVLKKRGYANTNRFHMTDWVPTLMHFAGSYVNSTEEKLDGVDQSAMLTTGSETKRQEIVYRIDTTNPPSFGYGTLSYKNYKLVSKTSGFIDGWEQDGNSGFVILSPGGGPEIVQMGRIQEWAPQTNKCSPTMKLGLNWTLIMLSAQYGATLNDRVLLFDVEADPEERNDLSAAMPEKVAELTKRLTKHIQMEKVTQRAVSYSTDILMKDNVWTHDWCSDL